MLPVSVIRQVRRFPLIYFLRPRLKRQLFSLLRVFAIALLFLLIIAFITPARNFFGYFFIPSPWLQLSSGRIIQMFYMEEQRFPVESGKDINCAAVENVMGNVDWQHLVSELHNIPVYDDHYYKNLVKNTEIYGTTFEDEEMLSNKFYNFKPPMSAMSQKKLRLTFKIFDFAMKTFNVTYFLVEGSMLGAYRHHGYIPWDDDMDLCMNGTDWLKVKQILHCIPGFDVDARNYMMYKFFWKDSDPVKDDTILHVPYIDIFFFTEDEEYIWALSRIKKHRIVFKKKDIFPLTYRPFEDQMVPVPRMFEHFCNSMYDSTICVSRDFDHFRGRPLIPFYEYEYKPCTFFKKFYPFVERVNVSIERKPATIEIKSLGKKVLSNFTVFH